jgi:hypothetical protein
MLLEESRVADHGDFVVADTGDQAADKNRVSDLPETQDKGMYESSGHSIARFSLVSFVSFQIPSPFGEHSRVGSGFPDQDHVFGECRLWLEGKSDVLSGCCQARLWSLRYPTLALGLGSCAETEASS